MTELEKDETPTNIKKKNSISKPPKDSKTKDDPINPIKKQNTLRIAPNAYPSMQQMGQFTSYGDAGNLNNDQPELLQTEQFDLQESTIQKVKIDRMELRIEQDRENIAIAPPGITFLEDDSQRLDSMILESAHFGPNIEQSAPKKALKA